MVSVAISRWDGVRRLTHWVFKILNSGITVAMVHIKSAAAPETTVFATFKTILLAYCLDLSMVKGGPSITVGDPSVNLDTILSNRYRIDTVSDTVGDGIRLRCNA
jgi:hypothetical protein